MCSSYEMGVTSLTLVSILHTSWPQRFDLHNVVPIPVYFIDLQVHILYTANINTLRPTKITVIQKTFSTDFSPMKLRATEYVPNVPININVSIGPDNGLAPNRRIVIIWHNAILVYWRTYVSHDVIDISLRHWGCGRTCIQRIPLYHDLFLNKRLTVHTSNLMMIIRQGIYIYSLNHHKGNGWAENTQPHMLYNR